MFIEFIKINTVLVQFLLQKNRVIRPFQGKAKNFEMDRDFADILKQIGCTDGLHVPVANEENRRLQNEVSRP